MSLDKRRLPWQQPLQSKERERYVYSYKELMAAISSFTSGPRSTGDNSQFTIKIAKSFSIPRTIYLTNKSAGLIIDGMSTLLTVDSSFVNGSYVFDVDVGSSEFPNVVFKNINFNAFFNEKKVTFIRAVTAVDIIDGYFNCWQLVEMSSISNKFTIIGNIYDVYDPTSDSVCNIIEGTGIVHCERNTFRGLSAGHCSLAGRLVGSFVVFNTFSLVSNEINLTLSSQNVIAFNRRLVSPIVGSSDLLIFNSSDYGSLTAGNVLTANGTGSQPTFQTPVSGSVNSESVTVDFGSLETDAVTATVPCTWVTATSKLTHSVSSPSGRPFEDAALEEIVVTHGNIVPGVSYDIFVYAPNETSGEFVIQTIGV